MTHPIQALARRRIREIGSGADTLCLTSRIGIAGSIWG